MCGQRPRGRRRNTFVGAIGNVGDRTEEPNLRSVQLPTFPVDRTNLTSDRQASRHRTRWIATDKEECINLPVAQRVARSIGFSVTRRSRNRRQAVGFAGSNGIHHGCPKPGLNSSETRFPARSANRIDAAVSQCDKSGICSGTSRIARSFVRRRLDHHIVPVPVKAQ